LPRYFDDFTILREAAQYCGLKFFIGLSAIGIFLVHIDLDNDWLQLNMSGNRNSIEQFQNELDANPFSLSAINQLAQHFANRGDYTSAI
jgi:hypothetical protein